MKFERVVYIGVGVVFLYYASLMVGDSGRQVFFVLIGLAYILIGLVKR